MEHQHHDAENMIPAGGRKEAQVLVSTAELSVPVNANHNHDVAADPEQLVAHPVARRLTLAQKKLVDELTGMGARPALIVEKMKQKFPDKPIKVQDIYNARNYIRRERSAGRVPFPELEEALVQSSNANEKRTQEEASDSGGATLTSAASRVSGGSEATPSETTSKAPAVPLTSSSASSGNKKGSATGMRLYCALLASGTIFSVEISDNATVQDLQTVIKQMWKLETLPVSQLKLYVAKRGGEWVMEKDVDALKDPTASASFTTMGWSRGKVRRVLGVADEALVEDQDFDDVEGNGPIHVLVEVLNQEALLTATKRVRVDDWFPQEIKPEKRRKVTTDEELEKDEECSDFGGTDHFEMINFPPMAHPATDFRKIVVRKSYLVIFNELMQKAKAHLEKGSDANMLVTGNPGIGKSRFYLYCIFRLVRDREILPPFQMVLNFGGDFHKYCWETREFHSISDAAAHALREESNVLRLVEAQSSILTGWKGVSILFSSPGLRGIRDFAKVNSFTYILPVWTLEEMQEYNFLLDSNLKLSDDVLVARYDKYGGVPRFVFTAIELETHDATKEAIESFSALAIISYAKNNHAVREETYSHRVLQMVPDRRDFRSTFHLDFLSKHIAEMVVEKVTEDSLRTVSEFSFAHATDESGRTSVLRGNIYEMLCHRWFKLAEQFELNFRSLFPGSSGAQLDIPADLKTIRFSELEEIAPFSPNCFIYCQPASRTFGALDAFIVDTINFKCYGLQMTLNEDHGIKTKPIETFLDAARGVHEKPGRCRSRTAVAASGVVIVHEKRRPHGRVLGASNVDFARRQRRSAAGGLPVTLGLQHPTEDGVVHVQLVQLAFREGAPVSADLAAMELDFDRRRGLDRDDDVAADEDAARRVLGPRIEVRDDVTILRTTVLKVDRAVHAVHVDVRQLVAHDAQVPVHVADLDAALRERVDHTRRRVDRAKLRRLRVTRPLAQLDLRGARHESLAVDGIGGDRDLFALEQRRDVHAALVRLHVDFLAAELVDVDVAVADRDLHVALDLVPDAHVAFDQRELQINQMRQVELQCRGLIVLTQQCSVSILGDAHGRHRILAFLLSLNHREHVSSAVATTEHVARKLGGREHGDDLDVGARAVAQLQLQLALVREARERDTLPERRRSGLAAHEAVALAAAQQQRQR
ncbi:hypothetical protein FI667_g6803, partial [Globisporangium splendens]